MLPMDAPPTFKPTGTVRSERCSTLWWLAPAWVLLPRLLALRQHQVS